MDESDGLENRYGGNLIVGSNPTPSASFRNEKGPSISFRRVLIFPLCTEYPLKETDGEPPEDIHVQNASPCRTWWGEFEIRLARLLGVPIASIEPNRKNRSPEVSGDRSVILTLRRRLNGQLPCDALFCLGNRTVGFDF